VGAFETAMTGPSHDHRLSLFPESVIISSTPPEELLPWIRAGRISTRAIAARLAHEGASGLVSYDDACHLLSLLSLHLEDTNFVLSPRRGALLLKDALFSLNLFWNQRGTPRYESLPPPGVALDQYFRAPEAMELIGSTVRMRPEIPGADLARVALVRSMTQVYPSHWVIMLYWDHQGGGVFFDRKDFQMVIVVDEMLSSCSDSSIASVLPQ